jgi:leucyl aminopeptidase (aminopeptidase T)
MHADVIVGASNYSLITTEAVKEALKNKSRFLSLPLSTNNGKSLLEFDLMKMDTDETEDMAKRLIKHIEKAETLRVTTDKGTDISFRKKGRKTSFFNGVANSNGGFGSASFEVYVAIEEDQTHGKLALDGSMGYIGKVNDTIHLQFNDGKISEIEQNKDGKKLEEYIKTFNDENMYHACEFGIGLNKFSKCVGDSYIEDESTFGTFHIGMGRNIALGGKLYANGHFDIVTNEPNIFADGVMVMEKGRIIV